MNIKLLALHIQFIEYLCFYMEILLWDLLQVFFNHKQYPGPESTTSQLWRGRRIYEVTK